MDSKNSEREIVIMYNFAKIIYECKVRQYLTRKRGMKVFILFSNVWEFNKTLQMILYKY